MSIWIKKNKEKNLPLENAVTLSETIIVYAWLVNMPVQEQTVFCSYFTKLIWITYI